MTSAILKLIRLVWFQCFSGAKLTSPVYLGTAQIWAIAMETHICHLQTAGTAAPENMAAGPENITMFVC